MTTCPRFDVVSLGAISQLSATERAIVYAAPGVTLPGVETPTYKEYKRSVRAGLDATVLEAMGEHLASLPVEDAAELLSLAAWPCGLVESAGSVRGVVVPAAPAGLGRHTPGTVPGTERLCYETVAAAARALQVLHGHGAAVGDLSTASVLLSPGPEPAVFFVDADRMRFRGASAFSQTEAADWELQAVHPGEEPATPQSDGFKLGLLALRLLSGDPKASDPDNLSAQVPGPVRELVATAIRSPADGRPAPGDWLLALDAAAEAASTRPLQKGGARSSRPKPPPPRPAPPRPAPPSPPSPPAPDPTGAQDAFAPDPVDVPIALAAPAGAGTDWWRRRPAVAIGAAAALLIFSLLAFAGLGGGDDPSSNLEAGGSEPRRTSTTDEPTPTTRDRTTTTTRPASTTIPTVDGWFRPAVAQDCDVRGADLLDGGRALIACTDAWALVNLTSGDVTTVRRVTSPEGNQVNDAILGDRYLWWDKVDVPASGLDPPTTIFTLRSRNLAGSDQKELLVLKGDQYSGVSLMASSGLRMASVERVGPASIGSATVVIRDVDGKEIARFEGGDTDGEEEIVDGIFRMGQLTVDLTRDELVPADAVGIFAGALSGLDHCAQVGLTSGTYAQSIVRRGTDGLRVRGVEPSSYEFDAVAIAAGDRMLSSSSGGLSAYSMDGKLLWELPREVAQSWAVFGGVPFVVNASQEVVAVDAATGNEATVSAGLREAAEVMIARGRSYVHVDSSTGNVLLVDPELGLKLVTLPECKTR